MIKKSLAFTLAEVLLTMTIIGVVAAMTIPTLHYQRVKKEYTTKLKNFYSRMDNAVLDMETDYGSFRDLRKPADGNTTEGFNWYMKYLDPYVGHQYVDTDNHLVYYSDGSMLTTFWPGGCLDVVYDVNGQKGPNQEGYDRFRFLFCFTNVHRNCWFGNKNIFFGTYGSEGVAAGASRDSMLQSCKNSGPRCTRLLQNDQWEFKSDYPYKF